MNENPIAECFAIAEKKLLDAIDRQRSKEGNVMDENGLSATTAVHTETPPSPPDADGDPDPDDMAAAYFAMQEKKKRDEERQNQKILDGWATIILRQEKQKRAENATNNQVFSLAEELFVECQNIVRS